MRRPALAAWYAACLVVATCGDGADSHAPDAREAPPDTSDTSDTRDESDAPADAAAGLPCLGVPCALLSEHDLFLGDGARQEPAPGVIPYDVNVPRFSNHALARRFIRLPAGGTLGYRARAVWQAPVGTTLVMTLSYPRDVREPALGDTLVETRLLIRETTGWRAHTYVWSAEQTEAIRTPVGARVPVTWIDADGTRQALEYRVPNTNECLRCHGDPVANALGLHTRQLERERRYDGELRNQLEYFEELAMFSSPLPPAWERAAFPALDDEAASLDARARAYLDANCSHCHDLEGPASQTGLWLDFRIYDQTALGVCRRPFSGGAGTGGLSWDIAPGAPDESVVAFRMASTEPDVRMPELAHQVVHERGLALIRAWIAAMEPTDCAAQ